MFCLNKVYHTFVRIMSNLKYYMNISTSSKSSDLRVKAQIMLAFIWRNKTNWRSHRTVKTYSLLI